MYGIDDRCTTALLGRRKCGRQVCRRHDIAGRSRRSARSSAWSRQGWTCGRSSRRCCRICRRGRELRWQSAQPPALSVRSRDGCGARLWPSRASARSWHLPATAAAREEQQAQRGQGRQQRPWPARSSRTEADQSSGSGERPATVQHVATLCQDPRAVKPAAGSSPHPS